MVNLVHCIVIVSEYNAFTFWIIVIIKGKEGNIHNFEMAISIYHLIKNYERNLCCTWNFKIKSPNPHQSPMFFLRGVELWSHHALWYSLCYIFRDSYNSNSMNLIKAVGQSRSPVRANKCITPRCCSFCPSEVRCAEGWGKGRKLLIPSSLHSLASLKLQLCNFLFFKLSLFQWLNLFFFFFPLPILQKSHSSLPDFLFLKKLCEGGILPGRFGWVTLRVWVICITTSVPTGKNYFKCSLHWILEWWQYC